MRFEVVVVGGGTAGISVAARLRRAGVTSIAIVEPARIHYYQPMWTLVGGGLASLRRSARSMANVVPDGVSWIKGAATAVRPESRRVVLADGRTLDYRVLVLAAGIDLRYDRVPGLVEALEYPQVTSVYRAHLAERTATAVAGLRRGTAVFVVPAGPVKCPGAGQKIAYLACDRWRRAGLAVDVHLVLPGARPLANAQHAALVERVIRHWGITVHLGSAVDLVDPDTRTVVVRDACGARQSLGYDLLHVVPPQSAPGWVAESGLAAADDPARFVEVDHRSLRHRRYPSVFALGDLAGTPNLKTGAAVRKQAPVVVANVLASLGGRGAGARYDGYACCPITVARNQLLLAEVDYAGGVSRALPGWPRQVPDPASMIQRYALPALYRAMLSGLA